MITLTFHTCEVCGAHAHEEAETYPDLDDGHVHSWYVEGLSLQPCDTCRLIVCASCLDDGFCCDRRAEIEGQMPLGQLELFGSKEEEPCLTAS